MRVGRSEKVFFIFEGICIIFFGSIANKKDSKMAAVDMSKLSHLDIRNFIDIFHLVFFVKFSLKFSLKHFFLS